MAEKLTSQEIQKIVMDGDCPTCVYKDRVIKDLEDKVSYLLSILTEEQLDDFISSKGLGN